MNVQDTVRADEDFTSAALIDAAAAVLARRHRDVPDDFLVKLFGLAVPEDLERYTADELAALAEQSWILSPIVRPANRNCASSRPPRGREYRCSKFLMTTCRFWSISIIAELNRRGLDIRLFVHPVFVIERDLAGKLVNFKGARTVGSHRESLIHLHVEGLDDAGQRAEILQTLEGILADVRISVGDWQPMLARIRGVVAELRIKPAAAARGRDRGGHPVS